jgi:hypothetical protein
LTLTLIAGEHDGEARSAEAGVSARRRSKMLWSLTSAMNLTDTPVPKGRIGNIETGERAALAARCRRWRRAGAWSFRARNES